MAFDLVIGTDKAQSLQNFIQEELTRRGYSDDDPVMAEYITIMLINNKTAEQIDAELKDLIGSDYGSETEGQSFTDWLFAEAKNISQSVSEVPAAPAEPAPVPTPSQSSVPTASDSERKSHSSIRTGPAPLYNQALNQALSSGSHQSNKRTASARSPSPSGGQPAKTRRVDVPTGPRAMGGGRSLLDRVGARQPRNNMHQRDDIQARIDAVTAQGSPGPPMMNGAFNNGMGGMMMPTPEMAAAMSGGMVNPMMLQEMMMNQMALMAQMANSMGALQGMGNMGQIMNGMTPDAQNTNNQQNTPPHRRGGVPGRGGRRGGGQGGAQWPAPHANATNNAPSHLNASNTTPATIEAPTPKPAAAAPTTVSQRPGFTPPERPQSPSLCKFGLKCTNALCRYSHPSPVATPESGMVLSKDFCENGVKCTDKDCVKGHVSPAAVGVTSATAKAEPTPAPAPASASSILKVPCRYGAGCLRINSGCQYSHPFVPKAQPCRFGAACTRSNCTFQHPPGRVLPGSFHRGLGENTPISSVLTPETGSMGGPSPHRSVVFNKPAPKKEGEGSAATKNADAPSAASETKTVQAAA